MIILSGSMYPDISADIEEEDLSKITNDKVNKDEGTYYYYTVRLIDSN